MAKSWHFIFLQIKILRGGSKKPTFCEISKFRKFEIWKFCEISNFRNFVSSIKICGYWCQVCGYGKVVEFFSLVSG